MPTKLITNDYHDVVVAGSGTVHLAYTGFSTQGLDLIIGFGTDDTLTHFTAKDDNGQINHDELELIGIFSDSILGTTQIGVAPIV